MSDATMVSPAVERRSDETVVSLQDVSFTYPDGTAALRDISLDIRERQVLGICGPSGCGKSSMLALLAGLREPTSGSIEWSADRVRSPSGKTRHPLSMVFQKDTLMPWATVDANVRLFYTLNRGRRAEADALVAELLELAGLTRFKDAYPYRLSGGMRRRVAFISAMAATPRVLLLDEPFSALDEPTRVAIHQDVLNIIRRLNTTVVLVTHDLAEAASLCDEVLILSDRPASIVNRHRIPFGRDRAVISLRQEPEFLKLYGTLWQDLSRQIRGGDSGSAPAVAATSQTTVEAR